MTEALKPASRSDGASELIPDPRHHALVLAEMIADTCAQQEGAQAGTVRAHREQWAVVIAALKEYGTSSRGGTWEWVLQSVRTNPDKAVIVRLGADGNLSFLHGDPTKELERELAAVRSELGRWEPITDDDAARLRKHQGVPMLPDGCLVVMRYVLDDNGDATGHEMFKLPLPSERPDSTKEKS